MTDKATLSIDVDTTKVDAATAALDRLAKAAERAAAAIEKLGGTPVTVHRIGDIEEMRIGSRRRAV